MIKKLTKLATFLDDESHGEEAGKLYDIISSSSTSSGPAFLEDVKVAAAYPGNMGAMEMWEFQRSAKPSEIELMDKLLEEDRTEEAWDLLKRQTGVDLHDPDGFRPPQSRKVLETIGDIKIYRDYDTGEYVVIPIDGSEAQAYFTDDLEDAVITAKIMEKEHD